MLLIKRKETRIKSNPTLALIGLRTIGPWMVKNNGEESFVLKKKKKKKSDGKAKIKKKKKTKKKKKKHE